VGLGLNFFEDFAVGTDDARRYSDAA